MNKTKTLDQTGAVAANAANRSANVQNKSVSPGSILDELMAFASSVPDTRRTSKGNIRHRLGDIIMLLLLARISGKVSRASIIEFGKHNLKRLQKLGLLKNGVPSEATLCRADNCIDDNAMADKMQAFAGKYEEKLGGGAPAKEEKREVVNIDGKAMRGTVQENGRNPDIVSAFSPVTGIVLASEPCQEKSNEIKAVPVLIEKIGVAGMIYTADTISLQKEIIDKIREKGGDFLIELKANQRSLRYSVEDRLKELTPVYSYTVGPELGHGRIETRTYRVYDGKGIIADKEKWGGNLTIVEYESDTIKKSTGVHTTERRLYVTSLPASTPALGDLVRGHWSVEVMHWGVDVNLKQGRIKRKYPKGARNLDTIQRMVFSVFSICKGLHKKKSDKKKGIAQMMRYVGSSLTKLLRFLNQK